MQRRLVDLNGSGIGSERAKISQVQGGDFSRRAEDIPSHGFRAGWRSERAGIGVVVLFQLFRQQLGEVDVEKRFGCSADNLRKVREHRLQSRIFPVAGQDHTNNRVVGLVSFDALMDNVHLGWLLNALDIMFARDVEVKLDKLVVVAVVADRDLAGVARWRDLDVVASVPDGGFTRDVLDADQRSWLGRQLRQING